LPAAGRAELLNRYDDSLRITCASQATDERLLSDGAATRFDPVLTTPGFPQRGRRECIP